MNRKGSDELLSIWWFFVLAVVGGGVVIGVVIFYSADVDIRGVEAEILSEKLLECIDDNGYLRNDFFSDFNMSEDCGISDVSLSSGKFYLNMRAFDESGVLIKETFAGDASFEKDCSISMDKETKAKHFPVCDIERANVLAYDNGIVRKLKVEILSGSNNLGGKIPL